MFALEPPFLLFRYRNLRNMAHANKSTTPPPAAATAMMTVSEIVLPSIGAALAGWSSSKGLKLGRDVPSRVGAAVGVAVGVTVGLGVGLSVGSSVPLGVGSGVTGARVGARVGGLVGFTVGAPVGAIVGDSVRGLASTVGASVTENVGSIVVVELLVGSTVCVKPGP